MTPRGPAWRPALVAAALALLVALAGGALTRLGPWYYGLRNPPWKPPDWLFGPAWTLIFVLTATAAVLAWQAAARWRQRVQLLGALALNAALNIGWSGLFFTLRRPDWALVEVAFLWLSILLLIQVIRRIRQRAAWLLLPYLLWVSFAAVLNLAIVRLNAPFGG